MEVYKRGNSWTVRIRYNDGINQRKSFSKSGFKTKKEASIFGNEKELQLKRDGIQQSNIAFDEYVRNWIVVYKKGRVSEHSFYIYSQIPKEIEKYFGSLPINKITKIKYQSFLDVYATDHVKESVQKLNTRIKRIIADAMDEKLITQDFTRNAIIGGKNSKDKDLKFIELDDLIKLNQICKNEMDFQSITKYAIFVGLRTGMRYGEVVGLTWDDIDFYNQTININKTYDYHNHTGFKPTKTESSNRIIDIDKETVLELKKLKQTQSINFVEQGYRDPLNAVFRNNRKNIPTNDTTNKVLRDLLKRGNIQKSITFHALRHSHVSMLIDKGIDISYISERLGHSNTTITLSVYAHLLEDKREKERKRTLDLIENIL
ncbi:site-specific integrase [Lactobacillus terrae]|uniref:site-specific integrase n=1 Tax=Lactobacillus terrae TaxID=2269374 RepID=UPI000C1B7B61|nr:site-specific integrase [Lactobacillus terrae]